MAEQSNSESAPLKQPQAAHTRVPNLIYDIVCPLLEASEKDCLLYILRRTYGFADKDGGRKERDTISLDQFEKGIVSGNYLLDLGTGLSKNTIRKALLSLEEKELIERRYSCLKCLWEQKKEDTAEEIEKADETKAAACPRCRASLSRSYSLAPLTPKKILTLLNTSDPQKRTWRWESKSGHFVFEEGENISEKQQQEDLREEALRLRNALWHPKLVDTAAEMAGKTLKSGKISLRRRVNNFYRPVWEFQEEFNNPPLIEYGLKQTIEGPVFKNSNNQRWHKYLKKVLENQEHNFTGKESDYDKATKVLDKQEKAMQGLLARAATLNGSKKSSEARALLSDILSQTKELAPLFESEELCDYSLREAFKRGEDYFVGIKPTKDIGAFDFYPEWEWPIKENQAKKK